MGAAAQASCSFSHIQARDIQETARPRGKGNAIVRILSQMSVLNGQTCPISADRCSESKRTMTFPFPAGHAVSVPLPLPCPLPLPFPLSIYVPHPVEISPSLLLLKPSFPSYIYTVRSRTQITCREKLQKKKRREILCRKK